MKLPVCKSAGWLPAGWPERLSELLKTRGTQERRRTLRLVEVIFVLYTRRCLFYNTLVSNDETGVVAQ